MSKLCRRKRMITEEYAREKTLEYFNGDELATNVFLTKYALRDLEGNLLEATPADMHRRIAKEFARIEKKKYKENALTEDEIFELLDHFRYIVPQGSPMYGIGNNYQYVTLSNCYLLDVPEDSYSSIMMVDEQLVNISKRRGGVGIDISNLRPAGTPTRNAARTSTGIVPFMERYSNSIREVGQAGRRGALMLTISVHHPQVLDFARAKRDLTKVTGANISIRLTDEFLKAVEEGKPYQLRFPVDSDNPQISEWVDARQVWYEIIKNAPETAEPGLLFWDNALRNNPADCYDRYRSRGTNPCSEIFLCPLDSCRLLLLNLYSYVRNPFTKKAYFDFDLFSEHCKIAQRLMDDLADLEAEKIQAIIAKIKSDPEDPRTKARELDMWERILKMNNEGRRTGTGITALGDTFAALGIKYASKKSIELTDQIYKTLKLSCYRQSVEMAKLFGPFVGYDPKAEESCEYIQRLREDDPELYRDMVKYGRRNVALLTTAPAGSVSQLTQTTSGIEPLFRIHYIRKRKISPNDVNARVDEVDAVGDKWQYYKVYHPKVLVWMEVTGKTNEEESPWHGACAEDLDWRKRVQLQGAAAKHTDHSISSTVNLPSHVTVEEVQTIYEEAWRTGYCKGITVYRDGCRQGVLVDVNGNGNGRGKKIVYTQAPERPKVLEAEIHFMRVRGEPYYVIVGLLDGKPYEVFLGVSRITDSQIRKVIKGTITKKARGVYEARFPEIDLVVENVAKDCSDEVETLSRLTSTSLRHGADVAFIVQQLEKSKGDLTSPGKAVARALKKYIDDGRAVTGESCPSCKGTSLVRQEGCVTCKDCGWSKCV
jgi:ribonucleoside-diphosphate reductase alpha chain